MSIKDRLQLILITYNRAPHVKNTLSKLLSDGSPVKNFDLLIIDNNSTDNTREIILDFQKNYSNITYIKNKYNVGLAGNIVKALDSADKDYVWILGDDDLYDFSNWSEVESAINNNEKIICVARYALPEDKKYDVATQLLQITFLTGAIYSTSLFNDVTIKNAYDNIYTLFPHLPVTVSYINSGGKIYVVDKPISDNGMNAETTDCSYTRGVSNKNELYDRTKEMSWVLGYSNVISLLKDKNLQKECLRVAIPYKDIYASWENFYKCITNQYINTNKINYFLEIYNVLPDEHKQYFDLNNAFVLASIYKNLVYNLNNGLKNLSLKVDNNTNNLSSQLDCIMNKMSKPTVMQRIFSVKNEGSFKVLKILGIKFKFRRTGK